MSGLYPGHLAWDIKPVEGRFSLCLPDDPLFELNNFRLKIYFQKQSKAHLWELQGFQSITISHHSLDISKIKGEVIESLTTSLPSAGLQAVLTLARAQQGHWALWHLSIHNQGHEPIWIDRIVLLDVGGDDPRGQFVLGSSPQDMRFYLNGWQSWSTSGFTPLHKHDFAPLPPVRWLQGPMIHNALTPWSRHAGHLWSETVGAVITPREALVTGAASLADQFVQVYANIRPAHHA
ncbi:MAG: hypothetical protein N3A60_07415, partial [Thermanaerothrix sp.]|nr:hypothetical protein [Thermanaerothrix sp.]